ncbi:MAG: helix-turn-helix domain-containing protein [Eubacteriales bacterium]
MDQAGIGNRIYSLRIKKGWTQKQLAEGLHLTDKAISKWERGLCYPDLSLLEPLATLLDITVPELLGVEQGSAEEVITVVTEISNQEKNNIKRNVAFRSWMNIAIGFGLFTTQIVASYIFFQNSLYGIPQMITMGLLPWTLIIVSNSFYAIFKIKKM